ncbi:MAG: CoA-binding protein [Bacteroidota bacterium]
MGKTIVLGASTNPQRVSYSAIHRLKNKGEEVIPIGIKKGSVADIPIINARPEVEEVDTITLYLNPKRQEDYYDYILSLNPRRIIFNPGTENAELSKLAKERGISSEHACTLVLLSTDSY